MFTYFRGACVLAVVTTLLTPKLVRAEEMPEVKNSKVDLKMSEALGNVQEEYNLQKNSNSKQGNLVVKAVSDFNFGLTKEAPNSEPNGQIILGSSGQAAIKGKTSTDAEIEALGVEIHDLRGTGKGWRLTAYLSEIALKNEPTTLLKDFKLTIPTKEVVTMSGTKRNIPTSYDVEFTNSGEGFEALVMEAKQGQGMGKFTNIFKWKNDSTSEVELAIPQTTKAGAYAGNVVWVLYDGPL